MYTAIIVEPREHKALSLVLNNFLDNLSLEWKFIIFHGNKNIEYLNNIFLTFSDENKNRITLINLNVDNLTVPQYNTLLKDKSFYNYIPTETFLIFQTDTFIIPQNKELINDFLEYDYVGAPWSQQTINLWNNGIRYNLNTKTINSKGGNGGLSLRKKSIMLKIIDFYNNHLLKLNKNRKIKNKKKIENINKKIKKVITNIKKLNEDLYFSLNPYIPLNTPSRDQAKCFSIETIYNNTFFGCHKPWLCITNVLTLHPEINELYNLQ